MEISHGDLGKLIGTRSGNISAMEKSHNCQIKLIKSVTSQEIDKKISLFDVIGHSDNIASVLANFQTVLGKKIKVSELSYVEASAEEAKIRSDSYVGRNAFSLDSHDTTSAGLSKTARVNQDELITRKTVSLDDLDIRKQLDALDAVEIVGEFNADFLTDIEEGLHSDAIATDFEDGSSYAPSYKTENRGNSTPKIVTAVVQCPIDAVGHLIGLKGSNLKRLCRASGCKIIIDEAIKGQVTDLIDVNLLQYLSSSHVITLIYRITVLLTFAAKLPVSLKPSPPLKSPSASDLHPTKDHHHQGSLATTLI